MVHVTGLYYRECVCCDIPNIKVNGAIEMVDDDYVYKDCEIPELSQHIGRF